MSILDRFIAAFDGTKFSNALLNSQLSAKVNEWLESISPQLLDTLMEQNIPIYKVLEPGQIRELRKLAQENKVLILRVLENHLDYILDHLPEWAKALRQKHGERGDQWLLDQLEWLEGMASGNAKMKPLAKQTTEPPLD